MTGKHYKEENLLPSNKYIEDCEFVHEHPFIKYYMCQVAKKTGTLLDDICSRLQLNLVAERQLVQRKKLDIRSTDITKDKLIEWLETTCYLLSF